MDDDKKQKEEINLGDWSPDYFPTSPAVVFKKTILLVLLIGSLCFLLLTCSEDESETKDDGSSKEKSEENNSQESDPFGDQVEELENVLSRIKNHLVITI